MLRMHTIRGVVALLVAGSAACGAGERSAGVAVISVQLDTVGGVVHVRNAGWPLERALRPLVRIGSNALDGSATPDEFGQIRSVVADEDGRIYVADALAYQVKVFDHDGGYITAYGRNGSGPGEFRDLYSLAWLGDTLAAFDPGNARIALLTSRGEWAGSWRHMSISGPIARLYTTGAREFYSYTVKMVGDSLHSLYAAYAPAGATGADLPYPRRQGGPPEGIVCRGEVIRFYDIPYAPRLISIPAPGGLRAIASTDAYRIALVNAAGDTLRVIEREYTPIPVSDAEWEAGLNDYREFRKEAPDARCEPIEPPRSRTKPAIRQFFFDDEGQLWVEAVTAEGSVFEVFDPEGRLLWQTPTPAFQWGVPVYVRTSRIYLVEADSLDLQSVRVYEWDAAPR